jgi:hypothetical protein
MAIRKNVSVRRKPRKRKAKRNAKYTISMLRRNPMFLELLDKNYLKILKSKGARVRQVESDLYAVECGKRHFYFQDNNPTKSLRNYFFII